MGRPGRGRTFDRPRRTHRCREASLRGALESSTACLEFALRTPESQGSRGAGPRISSQEDCDASDALPGAAPLLGPRSAEAKPSAGLQALWLSWYCQSARQRVPKNRAAQIHTARPGYRDDSRTPEEDVGRSRHFSDGRETKSAVARRRLPPPPSLTVSRVRARLV